MGRLDDAREIVTRLRVITSVVIPDLSYLQNADADRRANPSQATGARKRGDNQLHRFRVLEVRIHSPPGKSRANFRYLSGGAPSAAPTINADPLCAVVAYA